LGFQIKVFILIEMVHNISIETFKNIINYRVAEYIENSFSAYNVANCNGLYTLIILSEKRGMGSDFMLKSFWFCNKTHQIISSKTRINDTKEDEFFIEAINSYVKNIIIDEIIEEHPEFKPYKTEVIKCMK
jgi:hypothetical protein